MGFPGNSRATMPWVVLLLPSWSRSLYMITNVSCQWRDTRSNPVTSVAVRMSCVKRFAQYPGLSAGMWAQNRAVIGSGGGRSRAITASRAVGGG
jgi:hypothetical protein